MGHLLNSIAEENPCQDKDFVIKSYDSYEFYSSTLIRFIFRNGSNLYSDPLIKKYIVWIRLKSTTILKWMHFIYGSKLYMVTNANEQCSKLNSTP